VIPAVARDGLGDLAEPVARIKHLTSLHLAIDSHSPEGRLVADLLRQEIDDVHARLHASERNTGQERL